MNEFTCKKCGSHTLEEVMTDVTVSSSIKGFEILDGFIDIDYAEQSNEGGEIETYQCLNCGEAVANSQEELIEFLSK